MSEDFLFNDWMRRVNAILEAGIGLCSDDLEDWCWADAYQDGLSPEDAAAAFCCDIFSNEASLRNAEAAR